MEQQKRSRNWLTCGILIIGVGCLGLVLSLGGLAGALAYFGIQDNPTPTAQVIDSGGDQSSNPAPLQNSNPTTQPLNREIPFEAVVQIHAMYYENDSLEIGWTGSGSIISPDGLILTNAHVVLPDRYFPVDALAIAMTVAEDRPPSVRYYAKVMQADESLDIAVLQITSDINGAVIDTNTLNLPYVAMGSADNLSLGDDITILGYPGIGGDTITLTSGEVSGFTAESGRGDRAFIKTNATIAGGNSGGLAADLSGLLIGIPTQLGYGGEDQFVDCRVLADTNRDGVIDENDNCVPTGGFINALRPINLAFPLIEAARRGEVNVQQSIPTPIPPEEAEIPSAGEIIFEDDFSSPSSKWDQWSSEGGSVSYVDGEYHIEVNEINYYVWAFNGGSLGDVIINVDVRIKQSVGDADFGLICRYQNTNNFYGLEISEDGYYSIWKFQDGEFIYLADWQRSSHIPRDADSLTLTAACVGDQLTLAVDGNIVAEVTDGSFGRGEIGLVAGTWETPNVVIGFDNMLVTAPE